MDWLDVLWEGLASGSASPPAPSVLARQLEEERAAESARYTETLKRLFLGTDTGPSAEEVRRSVAGRETWHIPTTEDGGWLIREERAGRYRLAVGEEPGQKSGRGGRLLRLYSTAPEGPSREVSGPELLRSLPPGLDGLLLCEPPDAFVELRSEHFGELSRLLDALGLEEVLAHPGPDQLERLLRATWWVTAHRDGTVWSIQEALDEEVAVQAYSHPDRFIGDRSALKPMSGEELFRQASARADCDGIVVNRYHSMGRGDARIRGIGFGPGLIHGFLSGEDRRPGAAPLPAQTRAEALLWLRTRRFPGNGRLIEAPLPSGMLIRSYREEGSAWRMQETLTDQVETPETWSPVFSLADPDASGFGPGPSRILCPGLLAVELGALSHLHGKDPESLWSPGRSLIVGRLTDEQDRKQSAERLLLARELEKLLPEGAPEIPWSACLTVRGASVFRRNPAARTRDWIERTVRRAEQFTKGWVPGR